MSAIFSFGHEKKAAHESPEIEKLYAQIGQLKVENDFLKKSARRLGISDSAIVGYVPGDKAKLPENIVYNQLLYKGYDVKIGWLETQEIDFVATKNNETIYVQVALRLDNDKTVEREFGNLLKIIRKFLMN